MLIILPLPPCTWYAAIRIYASGSIIQSRYHLPVFTPEVLFLFCGRRATKIKGLLWEGDGFLLLTKRVKSGHFCWPRNSKEARQINAQQFEWLMKEKMDKQVLITIIGSLQGQLISISSQINFLTEQIALMNQRTFGRKTEKKDSFPNQLSLSDYYDN